MALGHHIMPLCVRGGGRGEVFRAAAVVVLLKIDHVVIAFV